MSPIAPRSQDHQGFARHNKFGTFPVPKDMNSTKKSAADAAAVATKIAANVDDQLHEEDDLPPLPWKKVTLAATLPDGANLERPDGKSHVQSTEDADTLDQHGGDHNKNVQQVRRTTYLARNRVLVIELIDHARTEAPPPPDNALMRPVAMPQVRYRCHAPIRSLIMP